MELGIFSNRIVQAGSWKILPGTAEGKHADFMLHACLQQFRYRLAPGKYSKPYLCIRKHKNLDSNFKERFLAHFRSIKHRRFELCHCRWSLMVCANCVVSVKLHSHKNIHSSCQRSMSSEKSIDIDQPTWMSFRCQPLCKQNAIRHLLL